MKHFFAILSIATFSVSFASAMESSESFLLSPFKMGSALSSLPSIEIPQKREGFNQLACQDSTFGQMKISKKIVN